MRKIPKIIHLVNVSAKAKVEDYSLYIQQTMFFYLLILFIWKAETHSQSNIQTDNIPYIDSLHKYPQ